MKDQEDVVPRRWVIALIALAHLLVFYVNVFFYPNRNLPVLYAVPLLLAALFLSPRGVLVAACTALLFNGISIIVEQTPSHVWPLTFSALLVICLSAYLLARKREEIAQLFERAELDRARWQATVECMPDPVTVADRDGRAIYLNPAYSRLIDKQIPQGLDLQSHPDYFQIYHPDGTLYKATELPLQRAALFGEEAREVEIVHRTKDGGEFVGIYNASPLRTSTGHLVGAVAVGRDITEQRKLEAERQSLLDHLQAALSVRDHFLNLAAHELKTPITVLRGVAQLLHRQGGRNEQEQRHIQIMATQIERMTLLVHKLETAMLFESGALRLHFEPVNLLALAEHAARTLRLGTFRHQIKVHGDEDIVAEVDRRLIHQVLSELIENAVLYSPDESPIDIWVQKRSEAEVEVRIHNEGPAIPEEQQERLFERFYQASPMIKPTTGMGLGLYLCQEIVRRHNGQIWVESIEGDGTTLFVRFPTIAQGQSK